MTSLEPVLSLPDLPFVVGPQGTPDNPVGLPNTLDFQLALDTETGRLCQLGSDQLTDLLAQVYELGSQLGTAMDDTDMGEGYAEDFLAFIEANLGLQGRSVLEIGAGRGYLLSLMAREGAAAIGVEPATGLDDSWRRHGVDVRQGAFPDVRLPESPFDAVVAYGVLEHLEDVDRFLEDVVSVCGPSGQVFFAVPDCEEYLAAGDPSILVHEHYSYFQPSALERIVGRRFEVVTVRRAGYGGALYVHARVSASPPKPEPPGHAELEGLQQYAARVHRMRRTLAAQAAAHRQDRRSLGVYCPSRALALLSPEGLVRFFDDDAELHGRYYPPFKIAVESRDALLADPVDELWIMSRTFGDGLRSSLDEAGLPSDVLTMVDLDRLADG